MEQVILSMEQAISPAIAAITAELALRVPGAMLERLNHRSLEFVLGAAIQRYATKNLNLAVAKPLLERDGFLFLKHPTVAEKFANEFAKIVSLKDEPDARVIGEQWEAAFGATPPSGINFTQEARYLLKSLEFELGGTDIFKDVIEFKKWKELTGQLDALADLLTKDREDFEALIREFKHGNLHNEIIDYISLIAYKTYGFVGRRFVFNKVNSFIENNPSGYFFIGGKPGIGKTALAAQMVKDKGYNIHHFNIRAQGINSVDIFLRNICAQLITKYHLDDTNLPHWAAWDARFLNRLLDQVAINLRAGEKAILVVDALDEADTPGLGEGANILYLPETLPHGIYVIATMRDLELRHNIRMDCRLGLLNINEHPDNLEDIRTYIQPWVARPGIQGYIKTQHRDNEWFDNDEFVELLVERSEGNFMYLHYVLPDIEEGKYKDLELKDLPQGLENYYKSHWRRMRGQNEEAWFKYRLPILATLTATHTPVSIGLLAEISGLRVQELPRIQVVLDEWRQFLDVHEVEHNDKLQKRYRMYHASFRDFIIEQEEVALKRAEERIQDLVNKHLKDEQT